MDPEEQQNQNILEDYLRIRKKEKDALEKFRALRDEKEDIEIRFPWLKQIEGLIVGNKPSEIRKRDQKKESKRKDQPMMINPG